MANMETKENILRDLMQVLIRQHIIIQQVPYALISSIAKPIQSSMLMFTLKILNPAWVMGNNIRIGM